MDDQCIYYTADRYNIILVGYYIQVAYYIYMYVCVCVCVYVHVYVYIYTYI